MKQIRRMILPILLMIAVLAAGCSAAAPTAAPAVTQAAEEMPAAPTAQPTQATEAQVPATGMETTPTAEAAATETAVPEQPQGAPGGVRFELVPDQSEARYRVTEQLANLNLPNDAIGKTKNISGAIVLDADGQVDPAESGFVVDVSTLQSDQSRRDNFLRRSTLQTEQYPTVTFVPKAISGLPWPLPETGDFNFQMTGDLTIRDVTREVTWTVTGTLENGTAVGQAVTQFTFADFNLDQPRVPIVLSIVDEINLELDVTMQRIAE